MSNIAYFGKNIHSLKSAFDEHNHTLYAFFISYLTSFECLVLCSCTNLVNNKKWLNVILYAVLL